MERREGRLGKYEIERELGSGAFATVFLAHDTMLHRQVALKVLRPALMADDDFVARFQIDARAAARLDHPHIITIHDLGQLQGRLFIDMKYMPGGSLDGRLEAQGPLPAAEALRILEQVASALDYAHAQGLVHRDVKPANILFDAAGKAVLGDFGMVKSAEGSMVATLTLGGVVGTPAYMAPELWEEADVTPATDVYALGCVLYDMLIGEALFQGSTLPSVMSAHLRPRRFPQHWPAGVPPQMQAALARAVAQEPAQRFASAGSFVQALKAPEDPLSGLYAQLQEALAAQAWAQALELAEEINARHKGYRDVTQLIAQARAQQAQEAAQEWRAMALQAEAAGDATVARTALNRWLQLTPQDAEALALQQRLAEPAGNKPSKLPLAGIAAIVAVLVLILFVSIANRRAEATAQAQATATAQAIPTALAQVRATNTAKARPTSTPTRAIPVIPALPATLPDMEVAAAEIPGIDLPRGLVPLREGVSVSTREEQAVRRFILRANLAETLWGWYLDTSYVQHFYGSDYLADYEELIETYHADDVKRAALFDYQGSYFVDIRAVGSAAYEADACEVWDVHAYRLSDESYLGQYEGYPRLIPQTLRLEQSGGRWVVSHSEFFEPPHFCE